MKYFISAFGLLLSLVAILLVMFQVDLLSTTAKANTTGGLQVFFDANPVFLVLAVGGAIMVASVMAITKIIR